MAENISFEICISVLDFISTVPKDHKPCYHSKTCIKKDAWFVTIKRRWNGEKGEYGIEYLKQLLNSCDLYFRMCLNQQTLDNLPKLLKSLKESVKGFDNLIETYDDQIGVKKSYQECKEAVINLANEIDAHLGECENSDDSLVSLISKRSTKSNFFNIDNITFVTSKNKN